nr:PREDICTED: general transcription factor II-I repeat domain-containing protein 2A-like [Latimeria chalumnae]|eukprot:XP_014351308.1 PREDICTED: general transcription factor II-I repeat domain-containing protein 2A-like [Latimeria chalumnae]
MSLSKPSTKKRKIDLEHRKFNPEWTEKYFFVESKTGVHTCLVCLECVAIAKEYNIHCHYETKHLKFKELLGEAQTKKIESLKTQLLGQQGVFELKNKESEAAAIASFKVAQLIAKSSRPFTDGEFVKDCMMEICHAVCKEKKDSFKNVCLSRMSIQRCIADMSENSYEQLKSKCKDFEYFSAALDESTEAADTAQLLIFIRGVTKTFEVHQELASLASLHGRTTGADIFNAFKKSVDDLSLQWDKLVGVTTDGAPATVREVNGFIGCLKKHIGDRAALLKQYDCIIHQEALCAKYLKFKEVMEFVVSTVNFIHAQSLNHREFQSFLENINATYGDVPYHTEARWLSRGNVLKRFFVLREEIKSFLQEKGRDTSVMEDRDWIAGLAFLTDVTGHLNDLNLRLQGSQHLICDLFEAVCAFQMKLKLFTNQLEKGQLTHFETCQEAFPCEKYKWNHHASVMKELQGVFAKRFEQFRSERVLFKLFADPFSSDAESVPDDLQLELIELQCSTVLKSKHREVLLLEFYRTLDNTLFPNLSREALKLLSLFGSTYICEQVFSLMKLNKLHLRIRLTDDNLHAVLQVATTSLEPDIPQLVSEKRCNISH